MDGTHGHDSMLEYAKVILPKVSFSKTLFRKELKKCIEWVDKEQINELLKWCYRNFGHTYPDVLSEAFSDVAA